MRGTPAAPWNKSGLLAHREECADVIEEVDEEKDEDDFEQARAAARREYPVAWLSK